MLPVLAAGAIGLNGLSGLANTYFQFKNLEYQKDIQNKIFNREDNSVQRRVADLKAAGLSPVLAAGQGAQAGPVVKTEAPQFDTSHVSNAVSVMQMANYAKQMEATDADISKTHAEQKAVEMQARKTRADAYSQEMNNAYQEKTGIPANVSLPAKILRDAIPAMDNARKTLERVAPVEDAYKVPFGSYKYGIK